MSDTTPVRIFGLDLDRIGDFRTSHTRNGGLYRALDARAGIDVVDVVSPSLSRPQERLLQATYARYGRDRWRQRVGLSTTSFRGRTRAAEQVLHAHSGSYDLVLQIACVFAPGDLAQRRPYVLYLDSTLVLNHRHWPPLIPLGPLARRGWIRLERQVYHQAHHIFTMSDWARTSVLDDYGVDPDRVSTVGAGTNLLPAERPERSHRRPVALFVGMEFARKGGRELLAAWRTVSKRMPDAELWIVGTRRRRPDRDGIRWFGRLTGDELRALYAESSLFVLPTLYDMFPHVLREALGSELPCVTTNTGAIKEIVCDGEDSILIEPGDVDALARALLELLSDPDRARQMGLAGRRRVLAEASWESVATRMWPHLHDLQVHGDRRSRTRTVT